MDLTDCHTFLIPIHTTDSERPYSTLHSRIKVIVAFMQHNCKNAAQWQIFTKPIVL